MKKKTKPKDVFVVLWRAADETEYGVVGTYLSAEKADDIATAFRKKYLETRVSVVTSVLE